MVGRKSKKVKEEKENIKNHCNEITNIENNELVEKKPIKKKRGRKPKKVIKNKTTDDLNIVSSNKSIIDKKNSEEKPKKRKYTKRKKNNEEEESKKEKPPPKKRGRKPKGGKVIVENYIEKKDDNIGKKPNIILHLKCSSKEIPNSFNTLSYNPNIENIQAYNEDYLDIYNKIEYNVEVSVNQLHNSNCSVSYNNNNKDKFFIDNLDNNNDTSTKNIQYNNVSLQNYENNDDVNNNSTLKVIWEKLRILQKKLHHNTIQDKKADCFWCTYNFNTPPVYIPKSEFKHSFEVYGNFCSPECACAFLCNENIDTSIKWERLSMLNNIYCPIFNYTKNIKPAPSPYYILDKYYGNMSIDEYRKLLHTDKILLVVEKPLTRVLPEIHDENDDYPNFKFQSNTSGNYSKNNNKYKLSRKKPTITQNTIQMWGNAVV